MPKLTSRLTRTDLQNLSTIRLLEARALADAGRYDGAVYLVGYAVECALKACIAKQTQQYEFPNKDIAQKSYSHVLPELVGVAGLTDQFDARMRGTSDADAVLQRDWALVLQWHEDDRYRSGASEIEARDFIAAAGRIVAWIQPNW